MKTFEYDLRYLKAGLEVMEQYLLSSDVFWPLSEKPPEGEPDYPQLTLGWILLSLARLEGHQMTADQKDQAERVRSDLDRIRTKWRVAWENKALQCYHMRIRMWGDFINEYQEKPQDNADRYAYEVRLRAMLELLANEIELQNRIEFDLLKGMDAYLHSVLRANTFIWEAEIQSGFPSDRYWFLYGRLPTML